MIKDDIELVGSINVGQVLPQVSGNLCLFFTNLEIYINIKASKNRLKIKNKINSISTLGDKKKVTFQTCAILYESISTIL